MTERALVIGAGPSGLAAALQLSTWCEQVDVVEYRARNALRHVGEHVPPAGIRSLSEIGLHALLKDTRHEESYGVRSAWDSDEFLENDYMFTPVGHGMNLRREVFDAAFVNHTETAGVTLHFGERLTDVSFEGSCYTAKTRAPDGAKTHQSNIIIDATGRHARAIRMLGGSVERSDALVGIFGRLDGCRTDETAGQLLIEAVEDGWLYGLSFEDGHTICAFMTDAPLVQKSARQVQDLWHDRLANSKAFAAMIAGGTLTTPVSVFDAASQKTTAPDLATCMAVGDAATAYDPLSSWGIVKGIVDGHEGAQALERQCTGQSDGTRQHRIKQSTAYQSYLTTRAAYYSEQPRWQSSPFWQARRNIH